MTTRISPPLIPLVTFPTVLVPMRAQQALPPGPTDNTQLFQGAEGILTIRTGVQLVLQDITVTDTKGYPIKDLKPEEFHILEDDRPQPIENFEEHGSIDPTLAEERVVHTGSRPGPGGTDGQ